MTIDENIRIDNPSGCPVTHFDEVNTESQLAGWHFDNFDAKREEGVKVGLVKLRLYRPFPKAAPKYRRVGAACENMKELR